MNTNYDNDATRYQAADEENTQYQDFNEQDNRPTDQDTELDDKISDENATPKKGAWQKAAIGGAAALVVGAVTTVSVNMMASDNTPDNKPGEEEKPEENTDNHPAWTDGNIEVATGVNDHMSFNEAFAAAREEVGPGGCFEWHGNVYGTYTAQEWNSMSAADQAEWSGHFNWNNLDSSSSNLAHHNTHNDTHHHTDVAQNDDIDIVSVTHTDVTPESYEPATSNPPAAAGNGHLDLANTTGQSEPEVEILGVVHDSESGQNIGAMTIDGQGVIFIDVDDNLEFDLMATDINQNGQLDENEIFDIQGQGFTVAGLGGFTEDPTGNLYASNDSMDMSDGMVYEG